jgi:Flp pilus assembly protein TadB
VPDKNNKKKQAEALMKAEDVKRTEMQNALKISNITMPSKQEFYPYPHEYMKFLDDVKIKPVTLYEKLCHFVENIFPIQPDTNTREKLLTELRAAYINATPKGVFSFAIMSTLMVIILAMLYVFTFGIFDIFGAFFFGMALLNFWYFYNYPSTMAKTRSVQMSADTVLAILYIVIYMRTSPNLEGAIKFTSQNLEGPLAWDLRKLLWDIETGKYSSAEDALIDYIGKWKDKNREFSEALDLLRGSAIQMERREMVYDETINVILNGTRERAKHYAAGLRMPMTLIYAMGVLLPVMGLVLFPIILIFISDSVKPSFVFFGYDILLPLTLYFVVGYVLSSKPPTFSPPDISKAKGVPPMGRIAVGGAMIPIWPIALLIALPFVIIGISGMSDSDSYTSVSFSLVLIFGMAMAVGSYAFLDSYQKMKTRNDVEKIENEFATALFQFGNIIASGTPLESALDRVRQNVKELKIASMFEIISLNMKKFGYTFEEALFDKQVGAIWYYPSKLIHSIMQTLIQSSKKDIKTAAGSMIVISKHLKGVHEVKEEIDEILGETTSSMKFLAMFLSPLVSGITVTLAVIILKILSGLSDTMRNLVITGGTNVNTAQSFFLVPWATAGKLPITPGDFQMIVGIYMIETAVLMAVFLNGVEYGDDPVGLRNQIWSILITAIVIYTISWFVTYSMFGGTIDGLLNPMANT